MKRRNLLNLSIVALATAACVGMFDRGQVLARPITAPGTVPDYFETPNWANSPPLPKFVDQLPQIWDPRGGGVAPAKCLPLAVPDTVTYPGSDYYEIELREYSEVMHSSMPATRLRGYVQVNNGTDAGGNNTIVPAPIRYLGPVIISQKDRPVRIKFVNKLPANSKLFLPVDTTIMGSGEYEINYDPVTKLPISPSLTGMFSQNRATLHLHGGRSPWISDGTPHQWITPALETTNYPKGVSVSYVPDMWFTPGGTTIASCAGQTTCGVGGATNNPGPGAETFYYTNQQSARLMFYHDHAYGITRLNVYAGEAAGYVITDAAEQALQAALTIPPAADTIPLIIQDKTFVDPLTIKNTDPTWAWGSTPPTPIGGAPTVSGEGMNPVLGDLWWPHVYMPAQNPYNPDLSGINAMGRWHYGPWFWPPTPLCGSSPDAVPPYCVSNAAVPNEYYLADPNCTSPDPVLNALCTQPPERPGTPDVSWGAEAFLDTMVVNGTAYPTVTLQPKQYRLRILNASHDRFLNLQLYQAANKLGPTTPGAGTPIFTGVATDLTEVAMIPAAARPDCSATVTTNCVCVPPTFAPAGCVPANWPADGREGGVPDPNTAGPAMIQIATEGGFLPAPVLLPNHPVTWNVDPTMFNVGNVLSQTEGGGTLFVGPAERADIIVDFSNFAGKTLILYNDAPTAFPALDPHYDYYTGAPDRTDIGGSTAIPAGVGPNIRTVMQIVVAGSGGTAPVNDYNPATLTALENAFKSTSPTTGVFNTAQDPIIVGQSAYNTAYNTTFPARWPNWGISRISDNFLSFMKTDGTLVSNYPMKPKAIHDEMGGTFDDYGRMSAKLGLEVPFSNAAISTFALQNYVDPATESVGPNKIQIWKITHNGVDTHPIHFHLFDVQLINRVGWDGFIRLPDPNELGWKDTVRISPLEDTIVALRPVTPHVPFELPNSVRPLNPTQPLGSTMGFSQIDPLTGAALATPQTNVMANFGWEYVWHCHILSHEENDMMRAIVFKPVDHVGVFANGQWYLDTSGNGAWDAGIDNSYTFGTAGNIQVSGDWNGTGGSKIGVYNNGSWTLDMDGTGLFGTGNANYTFGVGLTNAVPVTGDWTGNGTTKIGVYDNGTWYLDLNGNGAWNGTPTDGMYTFGVGLTGAVPVTGDWTGNGTTKIGVYHDGTWYLDLNGNGAWDGTPTDGMYTFGAGLAGAVPATGDWTGSGTTKIGVFVNGTWYLDMNGNGAWDGAPTDALKTFGIGVTGAAPVTGRW